ncbi:MAG: DUF4124 domain-containing protein [Saccharospirillaceae bacterium]|nr:DUF4124 domain-containing protein [Saccharospirillaceae bacterium]MCD8531188.1 DUF4124 domain-containing protein [Saccharospirillaceae bacterium]
MKSLLRIMASTLFFILMAALALELFWLNSTPEQRQHWLSVSPQPLTIKPNGWLLPQLFNPPAAMVVINPAAVMADDAHARTDTRTDTTPAALSDRAEVASHLTDSMPGSYRNHSSELCVRPPTQDIHDVERSAVYRWTDSEGNVHFGDRPQQQNVAEDLSKQYAAATQGVRLFMEYPGWAGDAQLEFQLRREADLLYRVLTRFIPQSAWRQINLNLVLFASQDAFDEFRQQQGANRGWMAYYSGGQNQAYLARQNRDEWTLSIARHEMTHAMMTGMLGTTPVWLSEGMAQYLERLQWQMNSAQVKADHDGFRQLAVRGLTGFSELADRQHAEFNGMAQESNYVRAAAMVFFLLDHDDGKRWLRQTLGHYAQHPCAPFVAERFFNQAYPGGLAAVNERYTRWLQEGHFTTHYY